MNLTGGAFGKCHPVGEGQLLFMTAAAALRLVSREFFVVEKETAQFDAFDGHGAVVRNAGFGNIFGQIPHPWHCRGTAATTRAKN